MTWLKTQGQGGDDRSAEKRLDRKERCSIFFLKKALNAMLKILAFNLKAVKNHLSRGETWSKREDNTW